jgi:hypothetical protein
MPPPLGVVPCAPLRIMHIIYDSIQDMVVVAGGEPLEAGSNI